MTTLVSSDNVQGERSVAQQPGELGKVAVENALKVIDGETVENQIPVPVQVVTQGNVSEFLQ